MTRIDHPLSLNMDCAAINLEVISNGQADSSLTTLLTGLSNNEKIAAGSKHYPLDWSDQGLFSDSDTETGNALKVAAQSVEKNLELQRKKHRKQSKQQKPGR